MECIKTPKGDNLIFSYISEDAVREFLSIKGMNNQDNLDLIKACLFGFIDKAKKNNRYTTTRERISLSFVRPQNKHKVDDYFLSVDITKIDEDLFYIELITFTMLAKVVALGEYN